MPVNVYVGWFMSSVTVLRPSEETALEGTVEMTKSSAVGRDVYPADIYPVFAQGNCYVLSADVVEGWMEWVEGRGKGNTFADDIMTGLYMNGRETRYVVATADFQTDYREFKCTEEGEMEGGRRENRRPCIAYVASYQCN